MTRPRCFAKQQGLCALPGQQLALLISGMTPAGKLKPRMWESNDLVCGGLGRDPTETTMIKYVLRINKVKGAKSKLGVRAVRGEHQELREEYY